MCKYLSIDIGGTNIKFGLFDKSGNLITKDYTSTPNNISDFGKTIDKIVKKYLVNIKGIAVSVPGKVDSKTGIVYHGGSLHYLDQFNFKHILGNKYHVPVEVENDGRAATLAEIWRGSMHNIANGAVIILGTGVGGGIIVNGKILRGFHDQAGEISFITLGRTIDQNNIVGKLCSALNMIEKCAKHKNLSNIDDGKKVFEAINNEDPAIWTIFKDYCAAIATTILNIHSVIDIQKVAIGGGISNQPVLLRQIKVELLTAVEKSPKIAKNIELPEIVTTTFLSDANLYGGLYNFLNQQTEYKDNEL